MVNRQRRLTSQELRNDGVLVCIDVSATSLQGLHDNVFFILYLEVEAQVPVQRPVHLRAAKRSYTARMLPAIILETESRLLFDRIRLLTSPDI
jgi:hypothetical protein